ncbi:MAG: DUF3006 domain-containing protein [Acutalibacteraceae bacterium]|jgi:hypothetical protein|nr:DUF3006 domain-containing protein [Clostridiales bacterium]
MQKYIVDRIESGIAVCEKDDGEMINIPIEKLPVDTGEGSIIIVDNNGIMKLETKEEKARKSELFSLQNNLFDN